MQDDVYRTPSLDDARAEHADAPVASPSPELHSQRMEALGRLSAGIGHDFKNLLTAILGNTHMMLEDEVVEARVGDVLRETLEAARSGAQIVAQLMQFSSPSATVGRSVDVVAVARRLMEMLERFVGEDVRTSLSVTYSPLFVQLDEGQIEQILMNLVINSREAMPSGGDLAVSLSEVQILQPGSHRLQVTTHAATSALKPGNYAVVEVSDSGEGIAADARPHIFEPFFSTKSGESDAARGLGLSTIYGVVHGVGGSIHIDSQLGRGTKVTVFLPLVAPDRVLDLTDRARKRTLPREAYGA